MRAVAREHARESRDGTMPPEDHASDAPARGRILVAEDNEVNQIVVMELMNKAGHRCQIVDNGSKAVEAAMSGEYDLVLMDCQMPEMDGFEASRIIRQKEITSGRKRIPIIALTANAMQGDREQCIAAGMDGHCAKPLDARQLLGQIDAFLKQLPPREEPFQLSVAAPQKSAEASSDRPAIMVDTLVERCMNNPAIVDKVIEKFEKQARRDIEQLLQSVVGKDFTAATRTAHALKGAAGMVAADRVAALASEIEQLGRQQQAEMMEKQLNELKAEIQRCIDYLPQVRQVAALRVAAIRAGEG
jgi:Amt family ammonium transporter